MKRLLVTGLAAATLAFAGCSGDPDPATSPTPSQTGTPSASATASKATSPASTAPLAPAPKVGSCWRLTRTSAMEADAPASPVKCSTRHTAQTYRSGSLVLVRNGHLLAVDSADATQQARTQCAAALEGWLGGDIRLSVLTPVWFTPTLEQSDAGAGWFRCDVVALEGADRLLPLPANAKGLLATAEGRAQFGLCRTAAPSAPASQPVPCSGPHAYRALQAIDLPGEKLPTAAAGAALMDTPCQDAATAVAPDPLQVSWEQELPTVEQWNQGRRYGVCWAPTTT